MGAADMLDRALDFEDDTQTLRRWLAGDGVTASALVEELTQWADHFVDDET
jgi:hypothetical protein